MKTAVLYFDGGSRGNPGIAAGGAVLKIGDKRYEASKLLDYSTNNEAEYTGLIVGLELALEHEIEQIEIYGDSNLIISQVNREWACINYKLQPLLDTAIALLQQFKYYQLMWIGRELNSEADAICNRVMDDAQDKQPSPQVLPDLPLAEPIPKLADQIRSFNRNYNKKSFKDFMRLKSGNDKFSRKKLAVLQEITPPKVRDILDSSNLDDDFLAKAYRWYWRGLHPNVALHKVNVDREVGANANRANIKSYGLRSD